MAFAEAVAREGGEGGLVELLVVVLASGFTESIADVVELLLVWFDTSMSMCCEGKWERW